MAESVEAEIPVREAEVKPVNPTVRHGGISLEEVPLYKGLQLTEGSVRVFGPGETYSVEGHEHVVPEGSARLVFKNKSGIGADFYRQVSEQVEQRKKELSQPVQEESLDTQAKKAEGRIHRPLRQLRRLVYKVLD